MAGISWVCTGSSNNPGIFRYTHFLPLMRRTISLRNPWVFLPGVSFFPGILVLIGISAIEAAIVRTLPMTRSEASTSEATGMTSRRPQPVYQPPQNSDASSYSPYWQGYLPVEGTRQGVQEQAQPKKEWSLYEAPKAQDPQALPPQQQ